jgi:hypothetical protein
MAEKMTEEAKVTADDIARDVYKGVDKNRFWIISTADVKHTWRFKSLFPTTYLRIADWAYRSGYVEKRLGMPPS